MRFERLPDLSWIRLGRSWALLGRSWAPFGLFLGALGRLLVTLPWKPPLFDLETVGFIDAWLEKVV